jgi:pimeloyl-ACP methyl ester carboxylesterase
MTREFRERNVLFLPGASGDGSFWTGVGALLPASWQKRYLNWPGLGNQPASSTVKGLEDLLSLAELELTRPSAVVAQSMGGIIAIRLALKYPDLVTHLVLVATSGGLDVSKLGAEDWRSDFMATFPNSARWILTARPDLSNQFHELRVPTLLIWGNRDAISPVAVGEYLAARIAQAKLIVVPGGDHSVGMDRPRVVASLIKAHMT